MTAAKASDYIFEVPRGIPLEEYRKEVRAKIKDLPYPFKRLLVSDDEIMEMMRRLERLRPCFIKRKFRVNLVEKKVSYFDEFYGKQWGDMVITKEKGAYDLYNVIADMFNEEPRIKSLGIASSVSSFDAWHRDDPSADWIGEMHSKGTYQFNAHVLREGLFDTVPEPRQGYPSDYVSLYSLADGPILDMSSAYGDRMIAAIVKRRKYVGIDPWKDLFRGYEKIKDFARPSFPDGVDGIEMIRGCSEDFVPRPKQFGLVISSPAPYDVEPYGMYSEENMEGQSYNTYPDMVSWMINYHLATIETAYLCLKDNGIYAATLLDRIKGKSLAGNREGFKEIIYTELFLLICSAVGFRYLGMVGHEGGKGSITPWWMFQRRDMDTGEMRRAISSIQKHYPRIYERIIPRLCLYVGSPILVPIREQEESEEDEEKGISYRFRVPDLPPFYRSPAYELARNEVMGMVVNSVMGTISRHATISREKVIEYVSDYIMAQRLIADPLLPLDGIFLDPFIGSLHWLLPAISSSKFGEILRGDRFVLNGRAFKGLPALMRGALSLANKLANKPVDARVSIEDDGTITNVSISRKGDGYRCIVPIASEALDRLRLRYHGNDFDTDVAIMLVRYASLGETTHNFTRDSLRYEELKRITGCDFEPFASPFNAFSRLFCSVFPDTDAPFGSQGNFFDGELISGVYSINPANDPEIVRLSIDRCLALVTEAEKGGEKLVLLVGAVTYPKEEKYPDDAIFNIFDWYRKEGKKNDIKRMMAHPLARGAYVLNNKKFKTIDPLTLKGFESTLVSIVTVLSSEPIDMGIFDPMRVHPQ